MSNHDSIIAQFLSKTDANAEQARSHLEANGWRLEAALHNYQTHKTAESGFPGVAGSRAGPSARPSGPPRQTDGPRVASVDSILGRGRAEEQDRNREQYFAGGERSGMMMQGAPRDGIDSIPVIRDIVQQARQGGQAPIGEPSSSQRSRPHHFVGTGYRLGSDDVDSQIIQGENQSDSILDDDEPVIRRLTLWRNGFSIDDGPLESYNDPANQAFLESIRSGTAPVDRLGVRHGQRVEVRVEERYNDDYVPPPKQPTQAFSGAGQRLGNMTPHVESVQSTQSNLTSLDEDKEKTEWNPTLGLSVDDKKPVTTLQIRLADGTRLDTRFNHTHTIGDIRRFIIASRPHNGREFVLQTNFPKREFDDEEATLESLGLLKAVVLQRYV